MNRKVVCNINKRTNAVQRVIYVGMFISDWSTLRSTSRAKTKGRPQGRPKGMFITERSARERFGRPFNKCWCAPAESRTLQLFCYQFSFQLVRCWLVFINLEWIVLFSPRALIRIENLWILCKKSRYYNYRNGREGKEGREGMEGGKGGKEGLLVIQIENYYTQYKR